MITPRSYQVAAIDASVAYLTDPKLKGRNGLVVAPTGSGKSVVIAGIATRLAEEFGEPTLVFQPSKELLEQNLEKMLHYGFRPAVFSASLGRREVGRITMATIGSVIKYPDAFRHVRYILVDETHVASARGGMYYDFLCALTNARVIGLSATPYRLASNSLGSQLRFLTRTRPRIYRDVVHHTQVPYLFDDGYLCRPQYHDRAILKPERLKPNTNGSDYTDASVQAEMFETGFVGELQAEVERQLDEGRRNVLVFTRFVHESARLAAVVPGTAVVSADTPPAERAQILGDYRRGKIRCVANVGIVALGFDYPELECVVLGAPTVSLARYYQQCLDERTEILTPEGWCKSGEMDPSKQVAAFDAATGAISWQPVLDVTRRQVGAGEDMYSLVGPHLNIRITAGHEMVVRAYNSVHWLKEQAADVARREGFVRIPVSGLQAVGGAPLSDDELRVAGWFLSDGNINKHNGSMVIVQSAAKPEHCAAIRSALRGAGLRFGEHVRPATTSPGSHDTVAFCVSRGAPLKRSDRHLRGWAHLGAWLDKSFPKVYETLDTRQLAVLLEAMNLGDGANMCKVPWERRTMSITMGDNEVLADRLQSLCVRRGYRCNKATHVPKDPRRRSCFVLHIKPVADSSFAGTRIKDGCVNGRAYKRARLLRTSVAAGESVWCVTNAVGTLVTRRFGKVVIVGNCGRIVRPVYADGMPQDTAAERLAAIAAGPKPCCHVVDMVGLRRQFGAVEDLVLRPGGVTGEQWEICAGDRPLTNIYFQFGDPAAAVQARKRRQFWAKRRHALAP